LKEISLPLRGWDVVAIYAKGAGWQPALGLHRAKSWEENVHVVTHLDALIRLVWAGKAEIVLAFSSNGLGRSLYQLVRVLRNFVAHKVALIIPAGGIDPSKVPGKVVLDTLDCIEQFKREVAPEYQSGLGACEGVFELMKGRGRTRARSQ
jgi:hypothetical protein